MSVALSKCRIIGLTQGPARMHAVSRTLTPLDLVRRMPADRPVFLLHSGECKPPFARYSIVAVPKAIYRYTDHSEFIELPGANDDERQVIGKLQRAARAFTHDPIHDLELLQSWTRGHPRSAVDVPFPCGWIGMLAYELGAIIEPTAQRRNDDRRPSTWPVIEMGWCPRASVFDHVKGEWMGEDPNLDLNLRSPISNLRSQISILRSQVSNHPSECQSESSWHAGELQPTISRDAHIENVARTIEHIRAGDIFQANITQQFTAPFAGNTRAFAHTALEASGAWYGAMLELTNGRTIVSMSPELFLAADHHQRTVRTRPIKGTRPRNLDPDVLERSEKDKAELAMIVDLMRNDLGRVCEIGSIRVSNPRTIETHGHVHQGVGEVTGTLPLTVTPSDLLRATFPPGSVTGCPKIRAMQIIDELEASPRGPYCGAIGFLSGNGHSVFSVAIRTVALEGTRPSGRFDLLEGRLSYGAGGGIVVDSDPAAEHEEMLDKTHLLRGMLAQPPATVHSK